MNAKKNQLFNSTTPVYNKNHADNKGGHALEKTTRSTAGRDRKARCMNAKKELIVEFHDACAQ